MKKEHVTPLQSVKYSDIFSDIKSQHSLVKIFQHIIQTRQHLRAPSWALVQDLVTNTSFLVTMEIHDEDSSVPKIVWEYNILFNLSFTSVFVGQLWPMSHTLIVYTVPV